MEQIVINGDNISILKTYPDNYFDAVVTDPPYGLGKEPDAMELMKDWVEHGYHEVKGSGFMGKEWDAFVPQPIFWKEVFRVLKHGGHVLSFFGTRTYDWGVMAMRFAGFEVRDCIQWIYGSGFPKSHNISKALDKIQGAERDVIGTKGLNSYKTKEDGNSRNKGLRVDFDKINQLTAPSTDEAKQWDGWGSALKPAHEDLVLARKPFQFSSDFVYLYENIVYNLKLQICQSKLFVKDAKEIFTLSQKESKEEELDFAQWSVGKPFNTKEDLSVLMDMLQLELKEENLTLNIVLSWLNILEELWNVANIYTTETESSTITELRILNSLEWESIFQNIILLKDKKIDGLIANVLTAESLFNVLNLKLNDIQTHFAKENAISKVEGKDFVPNSEQIVLARKPLEKGLSIAENVIKWGTGGINIDGCRINGTKPDCRNIPRASWRRMEGRTDIPESVEQVYDSSQGRFPANIILTHHPECECKGLKKRKPSNGSGKASEKGGGFSKGMFGDGSSDNIGGGFTDENGEETIEDWICHPDCPIKIMDEQSGLLKSGAMKKSYQYQNNGFSLGKPSGSTKQIYESSEGYASRFFKQVNYSKNEIHNCYLCTKANNNELWQINYINVLNAELNLNNIKAIIENIALPSVTENLKLKLNQVVKSVANPCDLCVTNFVQEVVKINNSDFSQETLQVIQDFIGNYNKCILLLNLVFYVEMMESIDTTPTTKNLFKLFGSALIVIESYIRKDIKVKEEQKLEPNRFLYQPKASKSERNKGLKGFEEKSNMRVNAPRDNEEDKTSNKISNFHPTVKPVKLMQYLVRLITPPNGLVLDPFCGSGTTGIACKLEGFNFVGMEQDAEYSKIAQARIDNYEEEPIEPLELIHEYSNGQKITQTSLF